VSDHVVFAIRALPVAVGASVLLGIGYNFAIKPPAWLDDIISYSWIRRLLKGCFPHLLPTKLLGMCTAWIVFLSILMLVSFNHHHLGFAFGLFALIVGTLFYYKSV
jgi:hypothetical protein